MILSFVSGANDLRRGLRTSGRNRTGDPPEKFLARRNPDSRE
jgi:hypothetical protein